MDNKKRYIPVAVIVTGIIVITGLFIWYQKKISDNWKKDGNAYRITQYGTEEDRQMMFYTIESSDGGFIIIDGGLKSNEQAVRDVIKKHGNHVDAWILTHPHPDHIGVFNAIMQNPGKISVDMVYDVYIDLEEYRSVAREWDEIDVYEEYLLMACDGVFNVTHLNRNDTIELFGLKIDCLNAYDDEVKKRTDAICNNGSMMLKIQGDTESFLFCSDVEDEMEDYLMEQYGDLLDCDYIQMSHHGNWGFSEKFYDRLSPKAAFFDGPASLYEESELYDGFKMMNLMKNKGTTLYFYRTAPNVIILK